MKADEFAFLNLQLAGMLRSGIPMEGALRQLCATMRRGRLRSELQRLETALANGTPLAEAVPSNDPDRRPKQRSSRRPDEAGGLLPKGELH
ncbi:MAG: type II secretion system F family protein [Verrucomicrobia bacterium]|nr:type II secretion system F family protein [Verrucomicrobiota bacterium]